MGSKSHHFRLVIICMVLTAVVPMQLLAGKRSDQLLAQIKKSHSVGQGATLSRGQIEIPTGVRRLQRSLKKSEVLSVHDAVLAVLERNADLAAARSKVEQARAQLDQARAAFRPNITFNMAWQRADAPSVYLFKTIDARDYVPGTNFNDPGVFDNSEIALGIRYPLWDAGRNRLRRQAAKGNLSAIKASERVVANALIGIVIQAYFDVLAARESVKVAKISQNTVDAQLRDVRARHRHGGALRSDVLSLEVRKAKAYENVIAADNARRLAEAAFRRLLDFPPEKAFELTGEEWKPRELPMSFAGGLEIARKNRDELQAMEGGTRAAKDTFELARREARPRLDLLARTWANDEDADFTKANWTVGAAFTWSITDGGNRLAKLRKTRAIIAEAKANRRSLDRRIEFEVRQAWSNLEATNARFKVASANVSRAEEVLDLVKKQFEGGEATITRYLEAETDRTEARFREVASRYAVKKSKAAWGHALGVCAICAQSEGE